MTSDTSNSDNRTLWLGDLAYWMDENYLYSLFVGSGELVSVKLIRNKVTNVSEGYGFIEFRSHEAAENVLKAYNGVPIPNTDQVFRLNWAAFGVGRGASEDFSVFVGDLAPDVTDYVLQEHFRQFFPSVRSAKVITDPLTSKSKGYGFVRFGSEAERDRALGEMNGHYISSRPIRVSLATAKKNTGNGTGGSAGTTNLLASAAGAGGPGAAPSGETDPTNTTLFIGGLSANVSEADLRAIFGRFGDIVYVKIPTGKGCGFVQYVERSVAERAMAQMHGQVIGNGPVRISWGRSSGSRGAAAAAAIAAQQAGFPFAAAGGAYGAAAMYAPFGAQPFPMYGTGSAAGDFSAYGGGFGLAGGLPGGQPFAGGPGSEAEAGAGSGSLGYQLKRGGANGKANGTSGSGANGTGGGAGDDAVGAAAAKFSALSVSEGKDGVYDPLASVSTDGLNGSYIQNHQASLVGSHLFA